MDTLTYGCKQTYSRLPSHTVSTCFHTHLIFFGHHRLASLSFSHVNSTDILWTLQCKHGHLSPSLSHSLSLSLFVFPLSLRLNILCYIALHSHSLFRSHSHTPLCCALISLSLSQPSVHLSAVSLSPTFPLALSLYCVARVRFTLQSTTPASNWLWLLASPAPTSLSSFPSGSLVRPPACPPALCFQLSMKRCCCFVLSLFVFLSASHLSAHHL